MENETKMIKLPINLGLKISEILKDKYNIEPRTNKLGLMDFSFTEEELNMITSLRFDNPVSTSLEGISLLPNLKSLHIETKAITAHLQDKNVPSITDKSIKEIAECCNLESLTITNQSKIGYVDVSKLDKLKSLTISHNQNLDEIFGMDNLNKLWSLECYGNNRLPSIENLDKVLLQNEELDDMNLDVLLFPSAIGFDYKTGEFNKEVIEKIREVSKYGKVNWSESLNDNKSIKINTYQMLQLHNKACEILENNVPKYADKRDTIIGIENYIAKNIKYDYVGKAHGHSQVIESGIKDVFIQIGPKGRNKWSI